MKLFSPSYLLALILHVTHLAGVGADTPIPSSLFINSPSTVIEAVAPLWHMDKKTCFPTAATQPDGSQTPGSHHDNCATRGKLDAGCPVQAPHTHQAQISTPFPTYYTMSHCDKDDSWRVAYNVFFQKDTGHRYDWEWAVVKLAPDNDNPGQYVRAGIWLEQDGNRPYTKWSDIPSTFNNETDKFDNRNKGRDHPKLYFGKWKHSVGLEFNDQFANDCLGAAIKRKDYHSDDYQYFAADYLLPDIAVPADYSYGHADSTPRTFQTGGVYDICGRFFV